MSTIILKYSDLFENDGGIEQVIRDLEAGQARIVQIAKDIKSEFNKNFDLSDNEAIADFEKQTENLADNLGDLQKAQEKVAEMQQQWNKVVRASNRTTDEQIDNLARLSSFAILVLCSSNSCNLFIASLRWAIVSEP